MSNIIEKLYLKDPYKNYKIFFRIPLTEYFIGWHYRLCFFRKVFTYNREGSITEWKPKYYFDKI